MYAIRRNGTLVREVVITNTSTWGRDYTDQVKVYDNQKAANEVASIWPDAEVVEVAA